MIERFVRAVRALAALPAPALATPQGLALVAECADALRLELDCPQQDFTAAQRRVLRALSAALESTPPDDDAPRLAAATCAALGIDVGDARTG